jgi:hypothetical protein
VFLLAAGVAAGCTSPSKSSSASSDATNGPSSTAMTESGNNSSPYPEWASAAVPDYGSGIVVHVLVNGGYYQIQTSDDAKTVFAWYKARVPGNWRLDNSDGSNDWINAVHGVQISIRENTLKQSNNVKTIVSLMTR